VSCVLTTTPHTATSENNRTAFLVAQFRCASLVAYPAGTEAFDFNEHSLGVFENDDTAAAAVWRHARGGQGSDRSRP
jgi:hypothetical protein